MSGPAMSRFLSQSHWAGRLRLQLFDLDTNQCQAIASIEPADDLDIELYHCEPTDDGASALVEGVRNSRGPSACVYCKNIDVSLLVEALAGNTSVKKLVFCNGIYTVPDVRSMQALADNLGLVHLCFSGHRLTDETLSAMGESLSTHPTLETLHLRNTLPFPNNGDAINDASTMAFDYQQRKTSRTNALVDMLRSNKKITSIELTRREFDEDLLDKELYPRLKINKHRPRFRAVKRIEGTLREPLLGRALDAVKEDASHLYLLLSGSTDINWVALGRTRRSRKRIRYTK